MSVNIINWYGRLGNNITQIINAIIFAYYKKINIINFPTHYFFKSQSIDLKICSSNSNSKINNNSYNDIFFSRKEICKKYNLKETMFENNQINIRKIIKNLFNLPEYKKLNISDNTLTIHIRSGDVYSKNPHPGWIQPPLIFYENIINEKEWEKIILICEDDKSPIIKPLMNKYKNISFIIQSLEKDINLIIQSKNICFGMGSFIPTLLLLNENLNTIYYPRYCYRYVLELVSYKNKKEYELLNYIKKGEWKNTDEQIYFMLKYE